MKKVKFYNKYPTNIDIDTEKDVEVYIDEFNTTDVPVGVIRIVILEESLKGDLISLAYDHREAYTYLLTYHQELLNDNPKAMLFHSTINSWIHGYTFPEKKFCVSALIGGRDDPRQKGYGLRHQLWRNRGAIVMPKDFYLSSAVPWKEANYSENKVLGESKFPLFDSQFHIAIENTKIDNYFSEKLLDCFQTKTVPIYYGCTNTHEYFNVDGILFVDNLRDIINVCRGLTPETYNSMLPSIEDNFNRSEKWKDCTGRVEAKVRELIQ
jgi:hypothetical protein